MKSKLVQSFAEMLAYFNMKEHLNELKYFNYVRPTFYVKPNYTQYILGSNEPIYKTYKYIITRKLRPIDPKIKKLLDSVSTKKEDELTEYFNDFHWISLTPKDKSFIKRYYEKYGDLSFSQPIT